jgi:hypothetical protein
VSVFSGEVQSYGFPNAPGSFEIFVSLVDNKVVWITYTKKNYGTITKEDTERLLRLNANGYIWTQTDKPHALQGGHVTPVLYSAHLDGKVLMEAWIKGGSYMVIVTEDHLRSLERAENEN